MAGVIILDYVCETALKETLAELGRILKRNRSRHFRGSRVVLMIS
ncbi:MAG: hypothetical protein V4719_31805 [Planctomycetota bacterium]